ncbi:hypothetical protein [Lactiplantibacillus carotarum]|nr:hypothetical protein [Lactiplantibacillus carotarum]
MKKITTLLALGAVSGGLVWSQPTALAAAKTPTVKKLLPKRSRPRRK